MAAETVTGASSRTGGLAGDDAARVRDRLDQTERLAGLGSFTWELASDVAVWSDNLCRMLGVEASARSVSLARLADGIHPDDQARVVDTVTRALRGEVPYEFEARTSYGDAAVGWVHVRAVVEHDAGGQPVRVFGVVQDVSARKRAEQAIRDSEESYRALFEASSDAIYVLDRETGAILDVNPAACALNGYPPERMRELGIAGLSYDRPPHNWENARALIGLAAAGQPQRVEWLARHSSGRDVWGEVTLQRVSILGEARVLATARDITDRKAAEAALRRVNEALEARVAERTAELADANLALEEEIAEREAAAAELRQRTEELEGVFRALPDLFFRLTRDGTVVEHRAGGVERSALPPELYVGRPLTAFLSTMLPAEAAERIHAALAEVNRTGRLVCVEYPLGGDEFEARLLPLEDGSLIGIVRDITEKKRAERELERREEHFRRLIENAYDMVLLLDAGGTITYASPSAQRVLGSAPEELTGRSGFSLLHPDDIDIAVARTTETAATPGAVVSAELRLRHRDGSYRILETFCRTLASDSAASGIVVNARDITERHVAAEALRQSEARYRSLIENAHDIVTILSPDDRILYQSPQITRILGYTPDELVGEHSIDYVHPDDRAHPYEAFAEILRVPGTTGTAEYRFRHKDGGWRHLETYGRTLLPDSVEEGVVLNTRDVTAQREIQRALRENEERFRRLIENSGDMIQLLDATGRITYTGPSVERLLGYTPEEIFATDALGYVHPDDVEVTAAALMEMLERPDEVVTAHYRVRHRAGHYRTFEAFARSIYESDGRQVVVVNARDVTERLQAERLLQEREEHFRKLIETSHDLVQTLDATGAIVYTGPSVERLLGYTPEEISGKGAADFIHPDDHDSVAQKIGEALTNPGRIIHLEYRVLHRDGRWRWFEAMGRTLSADTAEHGMVANARDITERKEAETELGRQRSYFEQLLASVDAGISAWDPQCRFEYVSTNAVPDPAARTWIVGKTHAEYYAWRGKPAEVAATRHHHVEQAVRQKRATEYEEAVVLPDGGTRHMLRRYWPVLDAAGEVERVIGYSVDITERKRAEEALALAKEEAERAREAAERANRAKSEFLSRMSHELRTPMNSILGFAQLLERAQLPPEHRKGVGHILKAGRHLLQLINEVLEIARIEAGRHALSLEPVRVDTVLQEAIALVRPLAAQWRVTLEEGPCAGGEVYVQADRQRLTQVLLNLLGNAIKYNRAGGHVSLHCEPLPDAAGGARLAVRLEDTGRGIAADRVDQLFTPFARLGAEQTEVEGTGLGLALSQRLTEAMGGTLALERTGAEGSVFRLELLLVDDPLQRLEDDEVAGDLGRDVPHASATLLYIEDNLANLSLVETILLSRPRWRTLPALQGGIGVELAREHRPDLILLDLHLPDISGEEVLRRLRADARTAAIPVAVITADATRSTVERLRTLGADAYLTKPLDIDDFLETVTRFLPAAEPNP